MSNPQGASLGSYLHASFPDDWGAFLKLRQEYVRSEEALFACRFDERERLSKQMNVAWENQSNCFRQMVAKARRKIIEEKCTVTGIPGGHYDRMIVDLDLFWACKHWTVNGSTISTGSGGGRYFEGVRITSATSPSAGRKPLYDWPALKALLKDVVAEKGRFERRIDLVNWCRDNARMAGNSKPWQSPDDKTIRHAIKKHGLDVINGP